MRIKEQEAKDKERLLMKKQAEAMRQQEEEDARKKQEKAHKMLIEVETSNQMAKAIKEKKVLEEKEMDDQIYRYNQQK